MSILKESQIKDELVVCPYCMNDWTEGKDIFGCCGEAHPQRAYLTTNDECYLASEVEIEETQEEAANVTIH